MNHEESKLQQQCVAEFRSEYPELAMLLVHPINEGSGHTQMDRRRQGIHKAEGAVAGVPDLLFFMPSMIEIVDESLRNHTCFRMYNGLGIEFKTLKGRQSQEQKEFQKMFEAAGYQYEVVRSKDEFKRVIRNYLYGADTFAFHRVVQAYDEITESAKAKEREKFYKVIGKK